MNKYIHTICFSIPLLVAIISTTAHAVVNIVETNSLQFGKLVKTGHGGGWISINTSGTKNTNNITSIAATSAGNFSVTGDNNTVTITITPYDTSGDITISDMSAKYGTESEKQASGSDSVSIDNVSPSATTETLKVGGKLIISNTASSGTHGIAYTIDVAYE